MRSLPPPIRKALLISALFHLGLFASLQVLLLQKGGATGQRPSIVPSSLSVRMPALTTNPVSPTPLPESPVDPTAVPANTQPAATGTEPGDGPGTPEPVYIPTPQLHQKPRVIRNVPDNTPALLSSLEPGTIMLRLQINESGKIDNVVIEETHVAVAELAVLIDLFGAMVFTPGIQDGKVVKSELRIGVPVGLPPKLAAPQQPAQRPLTQ